MNEVKEIMSAIVSTVIEQNRSR